MLCLCSTVPLPHSSDSLLLKWQYDRWGRLENLKTISNVWFAVELLTCFTMCAFKAISAATEQVCTRNQRWDRGAAVETNLTYKIRQKLTTLLRPTSTAYFMIMKCGWKIRVHIIQGIAVRLTGQFIRRKKKYLISQSQQFHRLPDHVHPFITTVCPSYNECLQGDK